MGSVRENVQPVLEKDVSGNSKADTSLDEGSTALLSEEFNSPEVQELSTILIGMGLEEQEVLLFTRRNMSLEKFLRLTDEDLQHVGITSPDKRKAMIYGINTLQSNTVEKKPKELVIEEVLSPQDVNTVLTNTCSHLNTISKAIPYIQRKLDEIGLNQFLNNTVSARHTLVVVAEKGVEQADQVCRQLQAFKRQVEEFRKQRKKKSVKSGHLIAALTVATTVCCVMLWKIRSGS